MLKTVSSITNAIGALNYKGTWDANANSPALASSVGTKGDYYVVGTAGATNLNGISNWGVGDLATFNGAVWQRVEGGADLNGVNLSVSGTSTLSGLTASTALALNASKEVISVTNTGTGNNVLATSPSIATPTLTGDVQMSTGNLVIGVAGKGIDFSVDPSAPGMTSELFNDYEQGTFTCTLKGSVSDPTTPVTSTCNYTKVGRLVQFQIKFVSVDTTGASGAITFAGLPFTSANSDNHMVTAGTFQGATFSNNVGAFISGNATAVQLYSFVSNSSWSAITHNAGAGAYFWVSGVYFV